MAKLVSVEGMRSIEKAADELGLSYAQMMENAGRGLASAIVSHSHDRERSVVGLVGSGNNGGDALVALAALGEQDWKTGALLIGRRFNHDELVKRARKAGAEIRTLNLEEHDNFAEHASWFLSHAVVLDGLLGTGIHLPVRESLAKAMAEIKVAIENAASRPYVVAVDCPSGMDCDSGETAPQTLRSDLTVTMAAVKYGMLTPHAFENIGELEVADIGLTPRVREWATIVRQTIDEAEVRASLPERPLSAHKGTFGTALIVAGSQQYPGAALLAARAAYRSGAGLVTVATPKNVQPMLAGQLAEATWLPLPADDGWIAGTAAKIVKTNLERATALLIGPGLGREETTAEFLAKVLKEKLPPLVIDADGLKLLAGIKDWHKNLQADVVLTPHPGEMAILSGLGKEEIQNLRIETAEKFAKIWRQVMVLKGAFTVVSAPDGRTAILPLATPALARAGTGDVLAGLITGLRAQGMPAYEAACAGVWLHGQASLRAASRLGGTAGVLAGDLISELPALIAK
jgi:NAD(P)H-hydrate epimerase